ncbi:hypothetical protein TeGR_g4276 [Tetraparma gracilis]|uniref:Flagellar associated protein n=1 Tax=Tetraparma gracilis TaxID=2962635 RepID=A0ABQ6N1R2_9STRA|nr:hypothetical protein TeGR_g4276 [Tetraparma gracilis]
MAECMMPARPSKEKSAWDRDASLASLTGRSPTVDRLYGDAKNPPRNAKALRAREKIASYVPPPSCKPEGYELMTSRPEMFNSSRGRETARYTSRGPETARVRDMGAEAGVSKKKADFGSGHPMWSPYYRPTGKTSDGKPIIPIDYFKQSSREWGAFKTDPNLVELGPRMLEANARLANNIKEQISFNPYPHHLSLTPRNSAGEPLVEKKVIDREDAKKMLLKMLASERPMLDRDEEFTAKFTRHMYSQEHKKMSTLQQAGKDPFKLSAEEMFAMKNEAKYKSKFVGPCMDMGHKPNWNYNEYHGAKTGEQP